MNPIKERDDEDGNDGGEGVDLYVCGGREA